MKVRTDAWHYKVFMWSYLVPADSGINKAYPVSLCPYFWRVFLALFWLPPVALFCLMGKIFWIPLNIIKYHLGLSESYVTSVTRKDLHPFAVVTYPGDRYGPIFEGLLGVSYFFCVITLGFVVIQHWIKFYLLICWMTLVISVIVFSILGFIIFRDKIPWNKIQSMSKPGNSLVWAYLSAVKQKVCPKIEFVDKD